MYLSRLLINPRSRRAQRDLSDMYELHRTIMRGFPERIPPDERVLYRLEISPRTGAAVVLVQSKSRPNWQSVEKGGSYFLSAPQVKPFEVKVREGQMLRFRLHANPTVKTWSRTTGKKTRVPLVREERQIAWLVRKGEQSGFRVVTDETGLPLVRIVKVGERSGWSRSEGKKNRLLIYIVQFDGFLEVTDPDKFLESVKSGIGPAKGFGCGLLSLSRW